MASKAIIRGPDLDSAKRDPNTGAYLDKVRGMSKRPARSRASVIRRAIGPKRTM